MKLLLPQLLLVATVAYLMFRSGEDPLNVMDNNSISMTIKYGSGRATIDPPKPNQPDEHPSQGDGHPKPSEPNPKPSEPNHGGSTDQQPNGNTNVRGEDDEIKYIFQKHDRNMSLCQEINQRSVMLCRLGLQNNCKRRYLSEELSSWWIICPIYTANTQQTARLYYLHNNFRDYVKSYGIRFQTVETIFPGQEFQLTRPNHEPEELQYNTEWIFAMRENLVNVGIKHLPSDWAYMSWVDQHIYWEDPYWFEKSIWLMSHNNIVHLLNGNDFWNLKNGTDYHLDGFARIWNEVGDQFERRDPRQCGLAWAMRREIFEELGGLLDICIGTKCDLYQNYAYAGRRYTSQTNGGEYAQMIGAWQDHAIKVYDRKLGFLNSKVYHFMHCTEGCKTSEYNMHVWALNKHGYSPNRDLTRDEEGRLQLTGNLPLAKELWGLYGGTARNLRR